MRIAILAHSTNPRGGVAHALALAEALCAHGDEAVVHAPDAGGTGFYRAARCATVPIPVAPAPKGTRALVETRIADYLDHFAPAAARRFDVFHAQDGISANALATLREKNLIPAFARTVHHVDDFADPAVAALQNRALNTPDAHFVVSRMWQESMRLAHGIAATLVGNGVDRTVFTPTPDGRETPLRQRLKLGRSPVILAVGGIEERKNTRKLLAAFAELLAVRPDARLVVAGGASLLDHCAYQRAFSQDLAALGEAARRVVVAGPIAQDDMPALYRIADVLAFPSLVEGFGLVALEAIACGTPVVVSRIAPFTEHFSERDVVWCDPSRAASIADAILVALSPDVAGRLAARADAALAAHGWDAVAARHLPAYAALAQRVAQLHA